MKINTKNLKKLIKEEFEDNQTLFANTLKIDRSHLNKIINSDGNMAGAIVCGAIIKYCEIHNLNYRDYIFL